MSTTALLKQSIDRDYPMVARGDGVFLFDTNGRDYLDGSSGAMTANIGHGVASVADALQVQAQEVAFSYRTQFTNAPAEELARRITALAPGDLDWAFFLNSGSEASEFAIRTAVNHWRLKGKDDKVKVLGRHLSYHGMTMGALSVSGHPVRRLDYGSLLHPFPVGPPAHAFRYAKDGESEEDYAARSVAEFEDAITAQNPETVAALIVEPIVGAAGGVLVPPHNYLARLRDVCDRLDILMIVDEVVTGMGRTGEWFVSSREGIVPDLLLTGKGISAGYTPLASVLLRQHLIDTLREGNGFPPFGHTFSANPLSAATCLAVLDVIEQRNLIGNVRARSVELEDALRAAASRHPYMVDVRGRGLLWGFDLDIEGWEQHDLDLKPHVAATFVDDCMESGLIVYPAGTPPRDTAIIISPPLTISASEVDVLADRLEYALNAMDCRIDSCPGAI